MTHSIAVFNIADVRPAEEAFLGVMPSSQGVLKAKLQVVEKMAPKCADLFLKSRDRCQSVDVARRAVHYQNREWICAKEHHCYCDSSVVPIYSVYRSRGLF